LRASAIRTEISASGGVAEVGRLHLPTQELHIDEPVENAAAILFREIRERTVAEKRFVAQASSQSDCRIRDR